MANPLFRQQVQNRRVDRLYGEISLAQPVSLLLTVFLLVAAGAALITFISLAEYSRKETVRGYLVPERGVIKSFPTRSGIIADIHVSEGDAIEKGQPIATLSIQSALESGEELGESLLEILDTQQQHLLNERDQTIRLHESEMRRLASHKTALRHSLNSLSRQNAILRRRYELVADKAEQYEKLVAEGFISKVDYQAHEQQLLIAGQEYEASNGRLADMSREIAQLNAQFDAGPIELQLALSSLDNRLSELRRKKSETQSRYKFVVSAPESGTVASIAVVRGEFVSHARPIASLIPEDSELIAELLLPTRSIGFVRVGDKARLRIEAFPYQRFGFVEGAVTRIDKAMILYGEANTPVQFNEPVYRVRAAIDKQGVGAYGDFFAFKSGMLLEADIILDKRSLLRWLLNPLFGLNGRVA